jgi:hypothetical protein
MFLTNTRKVPNFESKDPIVLNLVTDLDLERYIRARAFTIQWLDSTKRSLILDPRALASCNSAIFLLDSTCLTVP